MMRFQKNFSIDMLMLIDGFHFFTFSQKKLGRNKNGSQKNRDFVWRQGIWSSEWLFE